MENHLEGTHMRRAMRKIRFCHGKECQVECPLKISPCINGDTTHKNEANEIRKRHALLSG